MKREPAALLYIEVHNRRPLAEKQALARNMTDACARVLGVAPEDVVVKFSINTYDNIARAGDLLSDLYPGTV